MIIAFVVFAVIVIVLVFAAVFYVFPVFSKTTTIPGPEPADEKEGNLGDIALSGGLHNYLHQLHSQYGTLATFWWGPTMVVSLGSPKLIRENTDRTGLLFDSLEPLISKQSHLTPQGSKGRARRMVYDKELGEAVGTYIPGFNQLSEELLGKWQSMPEDQHLPLRQFMTALAVKAVASSLFGGHFQDNSRLIKLMKLYEMAMTRLYDQLSGSPDITSKEDPHVALKKLLGDVMKGVKCIKDFNKDEDAAVSDVITYVLGLCHTSSLLMTWSLYFLCVHDDVQETLHKELASVLKDGTLDADSASDLKYLRDFCDEVVRCGQICGFTTCVQQFETVVAEHVIPKETVILHAFAVALQDNTEFPQSNQFDVTRFSEEKPLKMPFLEFPEYRFAVLLTKSFLSVMCRRFEMSLAEERSEPPDLKFLSKTQEEIWIKISQRN